MAEGGENQEAIKAELRRIEEDCVHSGKAQFNAADRWARLNYWIGIPAVVVGAIAGVAYLKDYPSLAALFSTSAAILTALMTFLKPAERASKHKSSGDQYLALRNDARVLREVQLPAMTKPAAIIEAVATLSKRRNDLNQASQQFSRSDFELARQGIKEGEAKHAVDNGEARP